MAEQVTPEMRQAVRQEECRWNGHRYEELEMTGHDGPVAVMCSNCGRRWRVVPA
jgi:hypothetical protein